MPTSAEIRHDPHPETAEATRPAGHHDGDHRPLPPVEPEGQGLLERISGDPLLRLFIYYVLLIVVAALLISYVPVIRRAFVAPVELPGIRGDSGLFEGTAAAARDLSVSLDEVISRTITTALVIVGAMALVFPVAWVYMLTQRLRFDPALVRSVIILPIVVAGIALVVKNSIALAFALAGIVAAVRFRNTLKDPRDAVYIFLTIAIGLSAGVQALDVALVMSMAFNVIVLILWKYNIGSIYGGRYGRTGILSVGQSDMLVAQAPDRRREIRKSMLDEVDDMKTDGIILVHADDTELARHTVQEVFSELAKDWRLIRIVPRGGELATLQYLVRNKKKTAPAELVGALEERWSTQVAAAEYIPFRQRKRKRNGKDDAKDN